jgi:hypothetical protein
VGAPPALIGSSVMFGARSVKGPAPLGCRHAVYEATNVPPDGLFQGNLPAPAGTAMATLGLAGETVAGVSLSCDSGVFEYHRASEESLLVALDNRIWTLDRTAGTKAAEKSAEGVAQRFLEAHFAGDMGFWPSALASKRGYLSKALTEKIDAYFARITDPDEAPEIDGDPFSDSQDYPARFAVQAAEKKTGPSTPAKSFANRRIVPVDFHDAAGARRVSYEMLRENSHWVIDDRVFERYDRLADLLGGQ